VSTGVVAPSRSAALDTVERGGRGATRARSAWAAVGARVYLPALSIVAAGLALVGVGWALHWGSSDFAGSATSLRAVVAGPATLAVIGVFLVVERVWPAQRRSPFARGYRQDAIYTVLNATLLVPFVTALTLSFTALARHSVPWLVLPRVGLVPRWAMIGVLLVAMDLGNWAVHLANHRSRMLWRFHELHHSQEDMSVLTVFRTHPLIHVSYVLVLVPGILLIANATLSITVLAVYGAMVAFAHSNTRLGFGPLERIFVSPNYHRIHHKVDGPQDVNLGFALTVWDQLFRRAVFPTADTIRTDTGLPGRPLVVEQESPRPRHLAVFAAQMVAPFRPMHETTDLPPVRSASREPGGRA